MIILKIYLKALLNVFLTRKTFMITKYFYECDKFLFYTKLHCSLYKSFLKLKVEGFLLTFFFQNSRSFSDLVQKPVV